MKRVLLTVCSICLVAACIFGLFACVAGVQDILNIKDYKTSDSETAKEGILTARDGVALLMENQPAYLAGLDTFTEGLASYNEGYASLSAGRAQYAEGLARYEAGKKLIEENTPAYNEGKEMLATIEPLMPYLNRYVAFRDGNLTSLPGFSTAQAWFVGVVRPIAANMGLEIPEDVTDFPAYIQQMVADGQAQIKLYEDSLKQLEEAEAGLAAARKQLSEGEAALAAGGAQLADGDAQLNVFEQGEVALLEGGYTLFHGMTPCFRWYSGEEVVMSLPEYMAKELGVEIPANLIIANPVDGENEPEYILNEEAYAELCAAVVEAMYLVDENGEKISADSREGFTLLDLDKCSLLLDKAEQYLADQEADITKEVTGRIVALALAAIACILGIIAGIIGLVGGISGNGKSGFGCGLICAVLAVAANIVGLITHYTDYAYATRVNASGDFVIPMGEMDHYVYSGELQLTALIVLAVVAVIFCLIAAVARKAKAAPAVSEEATEAAAADAAAAAVAEESSEQIKKLEAENEALKEMVADLAAEAATAKE